MEDNIYYVYVHRKLSDNSIFYVGKGCNGRCRTYHGRNRFWWRIVDAENGFIPEIIKSELTEKEALTVEKKLINSFTDEELTNLRVFNSSGLNIPETIGSNVPKEATAQYELDLTIKQRAIVSKKDKKERDRKSYTKKKVKDLSILEKYFVVCSESYLQISTVKEHIINNNIKGVSNSNSFLPASKVAKYFDCEVKNKKVKGKVIRCIIGLKIKG